MKKIIICVFMLFGNFIFTSHLCAQTQPTNEIKQREILAILKKQCDESSFELAGDIVDQNNKPLQNVQLTIAFHRVLNPQQPESKKITTTVNEHFSVKQVGFTSVVLSFQKNGYFSEKLAFSTLGTNAVNKNFAKKDFKIIMREIGENARLKKKSSSFRLNLQNMDLSIFQMDKFEVNKKINANELAHKNDYMRLVVSTDSNNNVIRKKEKDARGIYQPESLHLTMFSKNDQDGFIIARGITDISYLTIAPRIGYNTKQIPCVFDNTSRPIFFFYRYGNFYGKGYIDSASITKRGDINAPLTLFQNTVSGDRNLRSKDRR
ncbi:MAG: hypothetical protein LBM70_06505 [Victivallales bacterium]|jgi:hypothetical protein|nr:hypothetical protein [Victivallales bacterium]